MPRSITVGVTAFVVACGNEPTRVSEPLPPAILEADIRAGEHNVLSAVVSLRVLRADSVKATFRPASAAASAEEATPAFSVQSESFSIPVLGLRPDEHYVVRAVAYRDDRSVASEPLDFTTASLPLDLPRYTASGSDPLPGYVIFAAGRYVVAIDNTGRVVWYRYFPHGAGLSFMAQPTGRYTLRPATPEAGDIEPWIELDPLGGVTRTLGCAAGLQPRLHDIQVESDGSYRLMCDETRTMDLSGVGGVVNARVTGTVVQHIGANGEVLFQWSPFDHFQITDLDPAERTGATVNWTHGNAIDVDTDGNLLVSFRSLGEITKIDSRTGRVIWRLGGKRNDFVFLDTALPAFVRQHSVRACGDGTLLLLDNVGNVTESRAERYVVDEASRVARLVHSYGSASRVVTEIGGSVQPLAHGRALVSFGTAGRVEEYDATGRLTWQINGNPGYVFRAQRVASLYTPGVGSTR